MHIFDEEIKRGKKAGCITTIIFHYSKISLSFSAMESIRKDWVLIMKVHFNLSAKDFKQAKHHSLSHNLSLPCREAHSNDLQIASSAKRREKNIHTHNTQLKADKHQAMCHIFSRKPKVEVLISGVGLLRVLTDTFLDVTT